ncbi:DUF6233 domain-containing protein [Streptomyces sp. NPDC000075]|uniref:DUF6233 domain-containing protein n=1 Tax=Streptomyces TaxID=1883 RepID=UPI00331AC283
MSLADRARERHRAGRRARPHRGCWDTCTRRMPATPDTARRAVADGVPACPQCRPDTALGTLDQTAPGLQPIRGVVDEAPLSSI